MTANIAQPFIKVADSNGNPIVGAKLYVYQAGTTTLLSTYSNEALSTPITNPLTGVNASNAAGNFPRVYIAAGTYKLRAETAAGVLIWEYDNIDTGLNAGAGALAISAGGTGATTAAAARTALGAASQTDVDDLADDIADLNSSLQNVVSTPQGYLTLTSGEPVISSDVAAATSIYYTPFMGNLAPIWNGTQHVISSFDELTLTLDSNHVASSIYDIFMFLHGGLAVIGTGPAWNTGTAGSGARGTGAGTTELERKGGLFTNKNAMTARNGATTYSIEANKATYLGSIFMDGTNGQITCHRSFGQNRKWGVWNAYNGVDLVIIAGDSTTNWGYNTSTIRASNGSSNNKLTVLTGLPIAAVDIRFVQRASITVNTADGQVEIGIGVNSTTAFSGRSARMHIATATVGDVTSHQVLFAEHLLLPTIGINNIQCLENTPDTDGNENFYGGSDDMCLSARWRG